MVQNNLHLPSEQHSHQGRIDSLKSHGHLLQLEDHHCWTLSLIEVYNPEPFQLSSLPHRFLIILTATSVLPYSRLPYAQGNEQ